MTYRLPPPPNLGPPLRGTLPLFRDPPPLKRPVSPPLNRLLSPPLKRLLRSYERLGFALRS
jgi:hypothetical protein